MENNGWIKLTGDVEILDGKDYHICFKHPYTKHYNYLGVCRYNKGFKDELGYILRPHPTHIKPIDEPLPPIN